MPKLILTLPDVGEDAHELTGKTLTIGRAPDNAIVVDNASVSGHHAELVAEDGGWLLRDLGSSNGTRINGKHITEQQLTPGDKVRFGSIEGLFGPDAAPGDLPLPPQETKAPALTETGKIGGTASTGAAKGGAFSSPFQQKAEVTDGLKTLAILVAVLAILAAAGAIWLAYNLPPV